MAVGFIAVQTYSNAVMESVSVTVYHQSKDLCTKESFI